MKDYILPANIQEALVKFIVNSKCATVGDHMNGSALIGALQALSEHVSDKKEG